MPTMVPLGSHWKQYMSTDTAPSCHRHAGSLNDPHSSVGVPKASVSSCFSAAKPSCALGGPLSCRWLKQVMWMPSSSHRKRLMLASNTPESGGREPLPLRVGIVPRRSGRAPVD